MKVIISPKERYELEMPAEVALEDFKVLVKKLNVVMSFVDGKDISAKQISQGGKKGFTNAPRPKDDVIAILKLLFTLSPGPEMDEALKRYNITYATANVNKWKWVTKYNFSPQDIGVEKFPEKFIGRPKTTV